MLLAASKTSGVGGGGIGIDVKGANMNGTLSEAFGETGGPVDLDELSAMVHYDEIFNVDPNFVASVEATQAAMEAEQQAAQPALSPAKAESVVSDGGAEVTVKEEWSCGLLDDCMSGVSPFEELGCSLNDHQETAEVEPKEEAKAAVEEPFTIFNDQAMQGMENGGEPDDNLKSDCMWSSSLDFLDGQRRGGASKRKRAREDSLTLSECAESLFKDLKDLDSAAGGPSAATTALGTSPGVQTMLNNYMKGVDSDEELNSEDDEEIDVVSDGDAFSSATVSAASSVCGSDSGRASPVARGRLQGRVTGGKRAHPMRSVNAGRSLLRNNRLTQQHQQQQQQQQQPMYWSNGFQISRQGILDTMLADHCYSAASPPDNHTSLLASEPPSPVGILTPNESSDDDDSCAAVVDGSSRTSASTMKQLEQAVTLRQHKRQQLLLAQQMQQHFNQQTTKSKTKFTFRLNLSPSRREAEEAEAEAAAAAAAAAVAEAARESTSAQRSLLTTTGNRKRRSSAMKNQHCPRPLGIPFPTETSPSAVPTAFPTAVPSGYHGSTAARVDRRASTASTASSSSVLANRGAKPLSAAEDAKFREIRDQHNSMERQRRVDLRRNFDALKAEVPDLRDADKASKLVILKRATSYVASMAGAEAELKRERDREAARNVALARRLSVLTASFNASRGAKVPHVAVAGRSVVRGRGVVTHSGRVSAAAKTFADYC